MHNCIHKIIHCIHKINQIVTYSIRKAQTVRKENNLIFILTLPSRASKFLRLWMLISIGKIASEINY